MNDEFPGLLQKVTRHVVVPKKFRGVDASCEGLDGAEVEKYSPN